MTEEVNKQPAVARGFDRWPLAAGIAGIVLMAGASLKAIDLMSRPKELSGLWGSRELAVAVVLAEICICAWLISGFLRLWAWRVLLVMFAAFSAYNLYQALMGKATCGCFGQVSINPWITMVLDLSLMLVVLACRPRVLSEQPGTRFSQAKVALAGVLLVAGIAVPAGLIVMGEPKQTEGKTAGAIPGVEVYGGLTIVDPMQWKGKTIPLNEVMSMPENWATGDWRVVFFRHDCSSCQKEVPELIAQASGKAKEKYLFVEVPPLAPAGRGLVPASAPVKLTALDPKKEWFVQTPVEVVLRDSVVTDVRVHEGH